MPMTAERLSVASVVGEVLPRETIRKSLDRPYLAAMPARCEMMKPLAMLLRPTGGVPGSSDLASPGDGASSLSRYGRHATGPWCCTLFMEHN
jgi:hypothetical protein